MDEDSTCHHVPSQQQNCSGQLLGSHRDPAELRQQARHLREQERRAIHNAAKPGLGLEQLGDDQAIEVYKGHPDAHAQQQRTIRRRSWPVTSAKYGQGVGESVKHEEYRRRRGWDKRRRKLH